MSSSQSLKRKRTTTSGEDATTTTTYNTSESGNPAGTKNTTTVPPTWIHEVRLLPQDARTPPPSVIKAFLEMYAQGQDDFKRSLDVLQRVSASQIKFEQAASNGTPPWIANHLKGPVFQFPKGILDEAEASLTEARQELDKVTATVAQQAITYFSACHKTTVALCKAKTNVDVCGQMFLEKMTAYAATIIERAGRGNPNIWEAYTKLVATAFVKDLETLSFEFTAALANDAAAKQAKSDAVAAAKADAEMLDATKPIAKLIEEKLNGADLKATVEAIVQKLQESKESSNTTKKSNPKPNPKSNAKAPGTTSVEPKDKKQKSKGTSKEKTNEGSASANATEEGGKKGQKGKKQKDGASKQPAPKGKS